jgi:hypothetical protein
MLRNGLQPSGAPSFCAPMLRLDNVCVTDGGNKRLESDGRSRVSHCGGGDKPGCRSLPRWPAKSLSNW